MSIITLKCRNCGANMDLNTESHTATCLHCGSTFMLADLLDEQDIKIAETTSPKNLEQKIIAKDALHQADTLLCQAEYEKAEALYKKAIEYDSTNYKAYLGVVRAKTQNLNVIPENNDYMEYGKEAFNLAEDDDKIYVKSELAKLDCLKFEKNKQKRRNERISREQQAELDKKKKINNFFTKIAVCAIVGFIVLISLGIIFFNSGIFNKNKIIYISKAQDFTEVFSDTKNYNSTIVLTADIKFYGDKIVSIGTKDVPFTGTFNGNNHRISNAIIYITDTSTTNYYGFFAVTKNATIKNVIFDEIRIRNQNSSYNPINNLINHYGIIAGCSINSTLENIDIKNSCEIEINNPKSQQAFIGGAVGKVELNSSLSKVASNTKLTISMTNIYGNNNYYIGGVCGYAINSNISNCYSNSKILSDLTNSKTEEITSYVAGIAGYINNSSTTINLVSNCFYAGSISSKSSTHINNIIAGIACGANKNIEANNYCLYRPTNYHKNEIVFPQNSFNDFSSTPKFTTFTESETIYLEKIHTIFRNWNNSSTLKPSLD